MATNRTRVFSPTDFIQRQGQEFGLQPISLIGITKGTEDQHRLSFALDFDRANWMAIPVEFIESVEVLDTVKCDDRNHPRVSLQLKDPQSSEAQLFASVAIVLERALRSVAVKIAPALRPSGDSTLGASDACLACLERCRQIVVTKDDPFAQIICMLNCGDCPG